jgi:hypothetical protein
LGSEHFEILFLRLKAEAVCLFYLMLVCTILARLALLTLLCKRCCEVRTSEGGFMHIVLVASGTRVVLRVQS